MRIRSQVLVVLLVGLAPGVVLGVLWHYWSAGDAPVPPTGKTVYEPRVLTSEPGGLALTAMPESAPRPSGATPVRDLDPTSAADEEALARTIVSENAGWLTLHDAAGNPIVDAQGRPMLSPLGIRYAALVAQAQARGIYGAIAQHTWAMAAMRQPAPGRQPEETLQQRWDREEQLRLLRQQTEALGSLQRTLTDLQLQQQERESRRLEQESRRLEQERESRRLAELARLANEKRSRQSEEPDLPAWATKPFGVRKVGEPSR